LPGDESSQAKPDELAERGRGANVDKKAEWVQRVLGVSVAAAAGKGAGTQDGLDAATLLEWLDDLNAQAGVLSPPARADLLARVKQQRASLSAADPGKAATDIEALANDIALAARAARVAEAATEAGDRVTYRRLQRQWQDAQDHARTQLETFVVSLLKDPELQADARYPRLQSAAASLTSLIPSDGGLLEHELAELDEATDPEESHAARARAVTALNAYSSKLEQEEDLKALQEVCDEDYDGIPFLGHLQQAVAALGAQLEKRV
jgi:hypothetical protein